MHSWLAFDNCMYSDKQEKNHFPSSSFMRLLCNLPSPLPSLHSWLNCPESDSSTSSSTCPGCQPLFSGEPWWLARLPTTLTCACVFPRSRIGCYVTVFQNISNLRDVFYREMSKVRNSGQPRLLSGTMVGLTLTASSHTLTGNTVWLLSPDETTALTDCVECRQVCTCALSPRALSTSIN